MTKSNQSIIKKADMTLASGGLLNPEQAENFIRKILQAPTILCLTESESEIDTANVVQLDEAPERIKTVMRNQEDLVSIEVELKPLAVVKG
jgi:hypothetical protein